MSYIIVEGSSPDHSAVFRVLEKLPDEIQIVEEGEELLVEGWYRVKRLSDGREFKLSPDHKVVGRIPEKFLGSKAVPAGSI